MSTHEFAKTQIDLLPESAVEKVIEFISFQRFSLGQYDSDDDDVALYDKEKSNDDGYRISSGDLRKKYGI